MNQTIYNGVQEIKRHTQKRRRVAEGDTVKGNEKNMR